MGDVFDGDYRRRPQQNLAGASRKNGRNELLSKVQQERKRRQLFRKQVESAIKMQAAVRSYLTRLKVKKVLKQRLCMIVSTPVFVPETFDAFEEAMRYFVIVYEKKTEYELLNFMTNGLIQHFGIIQLRLRTNNRWIWFIQKFATFQMDYMDSTAPLIPGKVFFETYLNPQSIDLFSLQKIYRYVIKHKYYRILRKVFDKEIETVATLPIRVLTVDMIRWPFEVYHLDCPVLDDVTEDFCRHFLCSEFTDAVRDVLLPDLISNESFPKLKPIEVFQTRGLSPSMEIMYYMLKVFPLVEDMTVDRCNGFFSLLGKASDYLVKFQEIVEELNTSESDEDEEVSLEQLERGETKMLLECINIFNNDTWIVKAMDLVCSAPGTVALDSFVRLVFNLIMCAIHNPLVVEPREETTYRALSIRGTPFYYYLYRNPKLLYAVWKTIQSWTVAVKDHAPIPVLTAFVNAIPLSSNILKKFLMYVTVFCALGDSYLSSIPDEDICAVSSGEGAQGKKEMTFPFSREEFSEVAKAMCDVGVAISLYGFPSQNSLFELHHCFYNELDIMNVDLNAHVWTIFLHAVSDITKVFHQLEMRKEGALLPWITKVSIVSNAVPLTRNHVCTFHFRHAPFRSGTPYIKAHLPGEEIKLTIDDIRLIVVLTKFPFCVSFMERVEAFHCLVAEDKATVQNPDVHVLNLQTANLNIRREFLYEDAYSQLTVEKVLDLRVAVRVHLVNSLGVDEAGVDGGGIFREFLLELLMNGFDPNRGFFVFNHNNELYPNPSALVLYEDAEDHFHFLGRMLGKAIYENLLVELPFADFFLQKLVEDEDLPFNNLASLDAQLYKNMVNLISMNETELMELGLDFTYHVDDYGKHETVDLVRLGAGKPVTKDNVMEYIRLVADYKLNKQLRTQTLAFKEGFESIVLKEWVSMFSSKELQVLISGTDSPIDLNDMEAFTTYSGNSNKDHPNIQRFWRVVRAFDNRERSLLLKFVTSCGRPPLLGFKELDPPFCIQCVEGANDRLPTSSTCMNLLKLPVFDDDETMKEKLLYAIKSACGFDLS